MGEKCVALEVEVAIKRGRTRKTWREVKDVRGCFYIKLSDAMDHSNWREVGLSLSDVALFF